MINNPSSVKWHNFCGDCSLWRILARNESAV